MEGQVCRVEGFKQKLGVDLIEILRREGWNKGTPPPLVQRLANIHMLENHLVKTVPETETGDRWVLPLRF